MIACEVGVEAWRCFACESEVDVDVDGRKEVTSPCLPEARLVSGRSRQRPKHPPPSTSLGLWGRYLGAGFKHCRQRSPYSSVVERITRISICDMMRSAVQSRVGAFNNQVSFLNLFA